MSKQNKQPAPTMTEDELEAATRPGQTEMLDETDTLETKDVVVAKSERVKTWTMNPARNAFMFDPELGMSLSIQNPYYQTPADLSDHLYSKLLKMSAVGALMAGKVEIQVARPAVAKVSIDVHSILKAPIHLQRLKDALSQIIRNNTQFTDNGEVRSAQNDLEALRDAELNGLKRTEVLGLINRALEGQGGFKGHRGGISGLHEEPIGTMKKTGLGVPQARPGANDPFVPGT